MFDLEEINLMPSKIPDRPETKGQDAIARAKAIQLGAKWKCTRVKAWVDLDDCVKRYAAAKGDTSGDYQPCLECSSIVLHLRNLGKGLPGPMSMQSPAATAPKFEPKPLPEPKPKEPTMARPAKKGTPDPIQQEAKTEPKLEIVEKKATQQNPFAGWKKFNRREQITPGEVYARIGKTSMTLSANAADTFGLSEYDSVDVYHNDEKLGLRFIKGKGGAFALTRETRGGRVRKFSCASLVKGLMLGGAMDRRLKVREIAPGFVEIDLKSEVAA